MNVIKAKLKSKMRTALFYMIGAFLLAGCAKQALAPTEYISWVRDQSNGLCVAKEIAGHEFILQYKPAEYEMLMQVKQPAATKAQLDSYVSNAGDLQFCTLTIITDDHRELAAAGNADENEYQERVMYMMSEMQLDFELVDGTDTLPCVFFHCERNFNISPQNNILLGFEKSAAAGSLSDKTLIYTDRILDCGPVKLTIKADDLENIPELLLSE
jgi:hypothetical protein